MVSLESRVREGAKGLVPIYGAFSTLESGQDNKVKFLSRSLAYDYGTQRVQLEKKSDRAGNLALVGCLSNVTGTVALLGAVAAQSPTLGILAAGSFLCAGAAGFLNGET